MVRVRLERFEDKRAGVDLVGCLAAAGQRYPAVDGIHPGQQFGGGKGLGDVVIGAKHQPLDLVHLLALGREHDDADAAALLPDAAAYFKAVDARQHDVQNGDVKVAAGLGKGLQGCFAAGHIHHIIAHPLKVEHHKGADIVFVLHHKDLTHEGNTSFLFR